jgi:hypothetical protein
MASRYDDKTTFIEHLDPIIRRQLEIYRQDPAEFVRDLPLQMNLYFAEHGPSRKISLGCLLAQSLIATRYAPTAEYIWKLMNEKVGESPEPWDARNDPGLNGARL